MKRLAIFFLSVFILGVGRIALGAGPIGPPEGFANDDLWVSVGAGYFWFETEWEPQDKTAFPSDITINQNIAFLQAGHVAFESSEMFIRLGAADLKETDGAFEGDYGGVVSVGYKGIWFGRTGKRRRSATGFGPILQGSYHQKYEKDNVPLSGGGTADISIENYWDVSLSLGVQHRLNEKILMFGGPFGYYSQANVTSSSVTGDFSTKFGAKNHIGVHAGVRFTPRRGWFIEAEAQNLSEISGGITLIYTY